MFNPKKFIENNKNTIFAKSIYTLPDICIKYFESVHEKAILHNMERCVTCETISTEGMTSDGSKKNWCYKCD